MRFSCRRCRCDPYSQRRESESSELYAASVEYGQLVAGDVNANDILAGCGKSIFMVIGAFRGSAPCIKDGFLPSSSLPLGEIRVREQAAACAGSGGTTQHSVLAI